MKSARALVIGSGILGASIAYHLAARGWRVRVLEAGEPGGLATRYSWAWINASWGNPEPYFRLRHRSMAEWRALAAAVPALSPDWSGGLIWDLAPDALEAYAREHSSWGYGLRRVDREGALAIEPALADPPEFALHVAEEGSIEPLPATQALIAAATGLGAEFLSGQRVSAIELKGDRAIAAWTDRSRIEADEIVIAAGTDTPRLLQSVGFHLPLDAPPGLLVHTKPTRKILNGLVMAPMIHVRQARDGSLIAGSDFAGGDPGADPEAAARDLFDVLRRTLRTGASLEYARYGVGHRPVPGDGFPALGRVPGTDGLYVAVTHSGVTLAPAIGLFAAQEIALGQRDPLLGAFGIDRFQTPARAV